MNLEKPLLKRNKKQSINSFREELVADISRWLGIQPTTTRGKYITFNLETCYLHISTSLTTLNIVSSKSYFPRKYNKYDVTVKLDKEGLDFKKVKEHFLNNVNTQRENKNNENKRIEMFRLIKDTIYGHLDMNGIPYKLVYSNGIDMKIETEDKSLYICLNSDFTLGYIIEKEIQMSELNGILANNF